MLVGVYGTLKKDFPNHLDIFSHGQASIVSRSANFHGMMLHLGAFPGLILRDAIPDNHPARPFLVSYSISAEVYSVDDNILLWMDKLEQHPNWYKRVPVVHPSLGEVHLYTLPAAKYLRGHQRVIPAGYWYGPTTGALKVDFGEGTVKPKVQGWDGQKPWIKVGDKWIPVHPAGKQGFNEGIKVPGTSIISLPPEESTIHNYANMWKDPDDDLVVAAQPIVPKEEKELHPEILIDTDQLYELKQA